jgi:bacillithiol biosynthesis cysteine-adding enzyme BshC
MQKINYRKINIFSKLINDYLFEPDLLKSFYNQTPVLENFAEQINFKSQNFKNREDLTQILLQQNKDCAKSVLDNVLKMKENNTFTVITGHQLNLFTGPLYVFYKIITVINQCQLLKENYPDQHFVPVFWMASEDHDFDEINHFYFNDKKISWPIETSGPVGKISTKSINISDFIKDFPDNENGKKLQSLFETAYKNHENLTQATRFLINHFFEDNGLVIVDGDDVALKKLMIPIIKEDVINQHSFQKINDTSNHLKDYHIQINPREINWFYIQDGLRERIIFQKEKFYINHTSLQFTKEELVVEIENHPERFSPNALLRPLYQEVVFPNLAYVGGAAEVAYWLELKSTFDYYHVHFPIVMLRDHVIILNQKQSQKLEKYQVKLEELFLNEVELGQLLSKRYGVSNVDFSRLRENLLSQFQELYEVVKNTDPSFKGAVLAEETRQTKGLDKLEKRYWKAEKMRLQEKINNVLLLKAELFPRGIMQERVHNFSTYYALYGDDFIRQIKEQVQGDFDALKVVTF